MGPRPFSHETGEPLATAMPIRGAGFELLQPWSDGVPMGAARLERYEVRLLLRAHVDPHEVKTVRLELWPQCREAAPGCPDEVGAGANASHSVGSAFDAGDVVAVPRKQGDGTPAAAFGRVQKDKGRRRWSGASRSTRAVGKLGAGASRSCPCGGPKLWSGASSAE